jgi:hypothetical protein
VLESSLEPRERPAVVFPELGEQTKRQRVRPRVRDSGSAREKRLRLGHSRIRRRRILLQGCHQRRERAQRDGRAQGVRRARGDRAQTREERLGLGARGTTRRAFSAASVRRGGGAVGAKPGKQRGKRGGRSLRDRGDALRERARRAFAHRARGVREQHQRERGRRDTRRREKTVARVFLRAARPRASTSSVGGDPRVVRRAVRLERPQQLCHVDPTSFVIFIIAPHGLERMRQRGVRGSAGTR